MSDVDLDELTTIDTADVYKAGVLAARLIRRRDGVEFSYTDDYLGGGGPPVATTLPLSPEPVLTRAGAVPPFFAGLLPEGRRLSSLRRAVKTSADDELSLLLAVGRDTVGDVQLVPEGVEPSPAEPLVLVHRSWDEVSFQDVLRSAGVDLVGIPGVQDKASAGMISAPVGRASERYVLKIDPPEYPWVVENEAYFLEQARGVGMTAASASVVSDATGRSGLLVRRFDRVAGPDGTAIPLACEDACQVLGRWPADKYLLTTEQAVTALADRCEARAVALRTLFQQVCFAWLTGNGDVHAKNLSILATPDGEWRVAPAYDLPSTVPYGDLSLALSIGGKTRGVSRRLLLAFADRIGLRERAAVKVLDELVDRLSTLEPDLRGGALPFAQDVTANMVAELRNRRRLVSATP